VKLNLLVLGCFAIFVSVCRHFYACAISLD